MVHCHGHCLWSMIINTTGEPKVTENVTDKKNVISNKVCVSGNMNINQVSNDLPRQLFILRGKNGDYLVHNLKCYYKDSTITKSLFQNLFIQLQNPIKLLVLFIIIHLYLIFHSFSDSCDQIKENWEAEKNTSISIRWDELVNTVILLHYNTIIYPT